MDTEGTEVEVSETPELEPKEQTPTAEERLKQLESQLVESEKRYKGLQKTVNEKDTALKNVDLRGEIDEVKDMIKILAAAQSQGIATDEETLEAKKPDLLKVYGTMESERKTKRAEDERMDRFRSIWSQAQEFGTKEDNDTVAEIHDALSAGNEATAARKLQKLQVKPEKEEPKESEEARIDRLATERAIKMNEEAGLNVSDAGTPSTGGGKVYTVAEIDAMKPKEYIKIFPDGASIMKAISEGRIKE